MNDGANSPEGKSQLRRRAEEVLQTRGLRQEKPPGPGELTENQLLNLIHEIQVHQIELEMQNEELRAAQAELAAARDRYFDLFDLAPVGYFMLNEDAGIEEVNLAGAELLGVKRSELRGRNLTHFVHEQDRDQFYLLCQQVYQTGERSEGAIRFLQAQGHLWFADMTCAQVKEPGDAAGLLRIILRDVTAVTLSERNLKSYAARLEALNRDLENFTSIASHDLQEPLRKIIQFGEFVNNYPTVQADGDLKNYIGRMQGAAVRMQALINDLLVYSRTSNRVPAFETLGLNGILKGVLEDLEARIESSGAVIVVEDLPVISAEPTMMRQLFQNLIGNSLKFHVPGKPPSVKIETEISTPEMVEIHVADEGIGFDEMELERIFQPFERLHNRNEYEGTGIGLAICRKIVDKHSGSLTARSKPGEGATFIIKLPVHQS